MKVLNKIKFVLDKALEILGTASLAVMSILVCYQVITRYVFNKPSAISEVLSQYLFCWMIMFGSAYVYGSREHLTIDILKDKFGSKTNMIVEIITNLCLFAFILVVCVYGGWLYTKGQMVQKDPNLHVSMGVLYASVPFTGIITLFYAVYGIVKAIVDYRKGSRKYGDELSGTA